MKEKLGWGIAVVSGFVAGEATVSRLHAQAKLPAYAVIEVGVTDPEAYAKEYAPLAGQALTDNGGKYLALGGNFVKIEGDPPKARVIVLAFDR
jgi:hypothetical protein